MTLWDARWFGVIHHFFKDAHNNCSFLVFLSFWWRHQHNSLLADWSWYSKPVVKKGKKNNVYIDSEVIPCLQFYVSTCLLLKKEKLNLSFVSYWIYIHCTYCILSMYRHLFDMYVHYGCASCMRYAWYCIDYALSIHVFALTSYNGRWILYDSCILLR